ncbi:DUF4136 domain-containing protein [Actimicrobium sp. CCC2.4]|uniref:DUF4136 domain-containing protein n=1 Tax=Actimicrobium sp. CCC2.4 TaxID=3048606 RepID=UPI002AC9C7DC|nr:DUF4136 domain-containing protein [Actimicrobium sp. CCC2.4]MEB0135880.1 DUF4136 domain-containing protein [Actimicrobium sp. CCC2.4]WPX33356.1 DUF4136 domain-containing protein [Actimicrobium sp. CCC2.4]
MKRLTLPLLAVLLVMLAGCASTVRSNVTVFSDWPADLPNRTYVFERTRAQDKDLEYLTYENLVRNDVRRLGLNEAETGTGNAPSLKITLSYNVDVVDVRTVQPVYGDPFFYGGGFYSRRHFGFGYDPFFRGPPVIDYQERIYQLHRRQLHVLIARHADGKSLYDVRVNSQGENPSLPAVMPYMVHSAFADFPGKNGMARTIDLKMAQ